MDAPEKSIEDTVLDAARSCILEHGVRRTTLAEIARRAEVSRPTVYRRWTDTRAVVSSLLTREISALIPSFDATASGRDQIVTAVDQAADRIRIHPLFVKILRSDSDVLATYILHRLGTSQSLIIDTLSSLIVVGQGDSSIRAGDPATLATMLLLMVQSAVQSAEMVSERIPGAEVMHQMAYAVDAYLRPRSA
ncbi:MULTISPECIES: TetR/AcrR family transcriptional regulator [Nocardiaceae]|uniref:Helix-turn-helix domain-containing protein n=1 Tax=Rhodococcoides yunnanense TaxID=278209 RepID=A0ABU4BBB9_9NOCA|nr:helix-turn-helix domain-containing protein [Rhodococcus yunnanensis]MDV6261480.1 helix-turn-helix domain-containing protein [Rhodococcus yunnanensis]